MTVADPTDGRPIPWWQKSIPKSWYMTESGGGREGTSTGGEGRGFYRDRDRDRDRELDLDDTRSMRRRYDDSSPPSPKIQVPFGVILSVAIYLIGQLVGGVWWAATLQSTLQHEISDRAKEEGRLWDSIQTYRVEVQALRIDLAKLTSQVARHQTNRNGEE
jgi:hypothetical protein